MRSRAIPGLIFLLGASSLSGQSAVRLKTYGTTRIVAVPVPASEFAAPSSDVGWSFQDASGATSLYQTTAGTSRWWAPVRVPDGARVEVVELEGCDETATGQIVFGLRRSVLDTGEDLLPLGATGLTAMGCG